MLNVEGLEVTFRGDSGDLVCVQDVSFTIKPGEVLGLVGESGCGKSVTSLAILKLLGKNGRISGGRISFQGKDLATLNPRATRNLRGSDISMIFQEPMTSLNPVLTVGTQLLEPIKLHLGLRGAKARDLAIEWLDRVGIPKPAAVFGEYPGSLSGGMRQRVMIAAAMICSPKLLIADEPTTALDVTIQKQILDLMEELRSSTGAAILLITHDLGIVAERADRVAVMYAGRIVEEAEVFQLFGAPSHPYTKGLLGSVPDLRAGSSARLAAIPGSVPSPGRWPSGCAFRDRCAWAKEGCASTSPGLKDLGGGHKVRCPLATKIQESSHEKRSVHELP